MMTDVTADVRTETPTRLQQEPQLLVHFILNGVPRSALADHCTYEGTGDRVPFATVKITHKITAEEARAIDQLINYTVSIVVESDDGSGKPNVYPFVVSRPKEAV